MGWSNGDLATAAVAAVAFVALIRPDLERALRRWTSSLDLLPAGRIEIGFSNFGPTVGLELTIAAPSDDLFVNSMTVTIERVSDHLRHKFQWAVFRPPHVNKSDLSKYEIAGGFFLRSKTDRRFSVQFHDQETNDSLRPSVLEVNSAWVNHMRAKGNTISGAEAPDFMSLFAEFRQSNSQILSNTHTKIDRAFYWTEGDYNLTIGVSTTRPSKTYSFQHKFSLTRADSDNMRVNCVAILAMACDAPDAHINFVFPSYA